MTTDPAAAQKFYGKVVGWGTAPFEGSDPPYTMWMAGDAAVGGVMDIPEEARAHETPPIWMSYIGTPDVDATAKRAQALGGALHVGPRDIPTVGRFAILGDPQGALFAAFTSEGTAPNLMNTPGIGAFSWHELL